MKKNYTLTVILTLLSTLPIMAQSLNYPEANEFILAETKQINQFFRRFNGEEDFDGKKLSYKDPRLRSERIREIYLPNLFDQFDTSMPDDLKRDFLQDVMNENDPKYLYHKNTDWYAQLDVMIMYEEKEHPCTLFLKIEKENKGSKWVLANVYFKPFTTLFKDVDVFDNDVVTASKTGPYLHPKSHEINFVNLKKAFAQLDQIEAYAAAEYNPDYLTLLIYELKRGNAELLTVKNLKFHFFQIDNWYFEVSEVTRKSKNSGWLISSLMKVAEKDKGILCKYIFFDDNYHSMSTP